MTWRLAVEKWRQNAGDHEPGHRPGPEHHHHTDEYPVAHRRCSYTRLESAWDCSAARNADLQKAATIDLPPTNISYPARAKNATNRWTPDAAKWFPAKNN